MLQNSLFPLRTIVGNAVPIGKASNIRQVFESDESKNQEIQYDFSVKSSIAETTEDAHYAKYLPNVRNMLAVIRQGEGMDRLPLPPSPRPLDDNDQVISFFAFAKKKVTSDLSRKLAARFSIQLPKKFLVGGVCFGGFPYVPYSRQKIALTGDNSSNFGLPREVRLTCSSGTGDTKTSSLALDFLDAEISATTQEIVSDSGFHYLCIDPTSTDSLTIHFSDYPAMKEVQFSRETHLAEAEHYGFIIPYFYIFEYKEKTRYRPTVSAGLLGTTTNNIATGNQDDFADSVDYRHIVSAANNGNYFDFTAASIFGQQREYTIREEFYDGKKPKGKIKQKLTECFISKKIEPQKNVVLYIEQGEEYERCIAGLKVFLPFIPDISLQEDVEEISAQIKEFFPNSVDFSALIDNVPRTDLEKVLRQILEIPDDIDFCEKIGIKVYELDPLEGVSPLKVDLDGKYATLLAEQTIDELSEISLALFLEGIRFVRPSNARYFAIELTNLDNEPAQFVIKGLKLVQSAHVSVHPRAAKTQQVRTLNFRIIGANLAEDYALLGDEGFNFSIERIVAGERKNVLFRANSLMDLLHTGAAKIFSNARRRAVEFEKTEYNPQIKNLMNEHGEDFERRYSESRMDGWRRSETGEGVGDAVEDQFEWHGDNEPGEFENYGTQEVRTHIQHLYPDTSAYDGLGDWFDALGALATFDANAKLIPQRDRKRLDDNFDFWKGMNVPTIRGLRQISASPRAFTEFSALANFIRNPNPDDLIDAINNHGNPLLLPLTGGVSSNLSVVFLSLGFSSIFPMFNHSTTIGSQGSITKQANKTGYTYSQFLNNGFDAGNNYSRIEEGEMKRVVTRKEVPNTDRQRVKGAEVLWQGELVDIITGSIPLNFTLPATASKMHFRTADDSLRVRFGSGVGQSLSVDFWFDLTEEMIQDDN